MSETSEISSGCNLNRKTNGCHVHNTQVKINPTESYIYFCESKNYYQMNY